MNDATTTIADSGTVSGEVDLSGCTLCGVFLPSTFDGTTLKFQAATESGGTFVAVVDGAGADVSKTCAASKYLPLNPADFAGVRFLKLVAGTGQTGATVLTLAVRPV